MATYAMTGRDGKTYQIDGPDGLDRETVRAAILKRAPQAGRGPEPKEAKPEDQSIFRSIADVPLEIVSGAATGGVKPVADAFGADNWAARGLGALGRGADSLRSAQSKLDDIEAARIQKEAEGKGTWEEIKAAGSAFMEHPIDTAANVVGSALPYVAAGALGGAPAAIGLGAVAGAGTVKSSIYDSVYEAFSNQKGVTPEQAEKIATEAQAYTGKNLDMIALGTVIGGIASATGVPKQIGRILGTRVAARVAEEVGEGAAAKGIARRVGEGVLHEAPMEGLQGGQERLAQNIALDREGKGDGNVWKGVAGQAAFEGLAGGISGGGLGVLEGGHPAPQTDPNADPEDTAPEDLSLHDLHSMQGKSFEENRQSVYDRFRDRGMDQQEAMRVADHWAGLAREADARAAEAAAAGAPGEDEDEDTGGTTPPPPPPPGAGASASAAPDVEEDIPGFEEEEAPDVETEALRHRKAQLEHALGDGLDQTEEAARAHGDPRDTIEKLQGELDGIKQQLAKRVSPAAPMDIEPKQEVHDEPLLHRKAQLEHALGDGIEETETRAREQGDPADVIENLQLELKNINETLMARSQVAPNPAFQAAEQEAAAPTPMDDLRAAQVKLDRGDMTREQTIPIMNAAEAYRRGEPAPDSGARFSHQRVPEGQGGFDLAPPSEEGRSAEPDLPPSIAPPPAQGGFDLEAPTEEGRSAEPNLPPSEPPSTEQLQMELEALNKARQGNTPQAIMLRREIAKRPGRALNRAAKKAQTSLWDAQDQTTPEQAAEAEAAIAEQQAQFADNEEERRAEAFQQAQEMIDYGGKPYEGYQVSHEPGNASPFRVRGADGELVFAAKTLEDFKEKAGDLKPYEKPYDPRDKQAGAVTAGTQLLQDLNDQIDAARSRNEITDAEVAELKAPQARKPSTKKDASGVPVDPILNAEHRARVAQTALDRASSPEEKAAAEKEVFLRSEVLRDAIERHFGKATREALAQKIADRKGTISKAQKDAQTAQQEHDEAALMAHLGLKDIADLNPNDRAQIEDMQGYVREYEESAKESKAKVTQAKAKAKAARPTARFKTGSKGTGAHKSQVQAVVDTITAKWAGAPSIKVYQSFDDLPVQVQVALGEGNRGAPGVAMDNGIAYLIADNIHSPAHVKAVVFHEGLGHLGMTKAFGDNLDQVLMNLHDGNVMLREETKLWQEQNPDTYAHLGKRQQLLRAIEEVLAERSEAGRIEPNIMKRLVALVRDFARRMKLRVAFSDADVMAVLARAHTAMVKGKKGGAKVDPHRKFELSPETRRLMRTDEEMLSEGETKIDMGTTADELLSGFFGRIKGTGVKGTVQAIRENYNSMTAANVKPLIGLLPMSGITDIWADKVSGLMDLVKMLRGIGDMKTNLIKGSEAQGRRIQRFIDKHGSKGAKALSDAEHQGRIDGVRASDFADVDDALANNKGMKGLRARIVANSNDKAVARAAIATIIAEVKAGRVYVAGTGRAAYTPTVRRARQTLRRTSIDSTAANRLVNQLMQHSANVRGVMRAWAELGKYAGGQKILSDMRQYYADMYAAELAYVDAKLNNLPAAAQASIRKARADAMKQSTNLTAAQKAGDPFWDLPGDWFAKDYFPLMREGKYWLRIPAAGKRPRMFRTFTSAAARDRAQRAYTKQFNLAPDAATKGDDIRELAQEFKDSDAMMKSVFDSLHGLQQSGGANVQSVIDDVYQVWLMSSPERSVRRRYMHADEVAGFSDDVLLHFRKSVTGYANQLSKLAFAEKLRLQLETMEAALQGMPTDEQAKQRIVIEEMGKQVESALNPKEQGNIARVLNAVSFSHFLSGIGSALVQTTAVPIRVVPRLWRDHGVRKGTKVWGKYMKLWDVLGAPKWNDKTDSWLNRGMPGIENASFIKNDPLLKRAYAEGEARNMMGATVDQMTTNERTDPMSERGVGGKTMRGLSWANKAMALPFTAAEGISRQVSWMMSFELQHEKLTKENLSTYEQEELASSTLAANANAAGKTPAVYAREAAEERVFQESLDYARDVVNDSVGDLSTLERPRLLRGEWAKSLTMYKLYTIKQTQWVMRTAVNMWRHSKGSVVGQNKAESRKALAGLLKETAGVMLFSTLIGGASTWPLYSVMVWAIQAALAAMTDDDDEMRELAKPTSDLGTAHDPDLAFREFLKEKSQGMGIYGIDGRHHLFGDIFVNGPISELSDTALGPRVSLDLKSMWYREGISGDNDFETSVNAVFANIAPLAMLKAMLYDSREDWANGEPEKAAAKIAPAFVRSWITLYGLNKEGVVGDKGDITMDRSQFNALNMIGAAGGLRSQRLSDLQDKAITRAGTTRRINAERTKIMTQFNKLVYEGGTQEEKAEYLKEKVIAFNRRYPKPGVMILEPNLISSYRSYVRERGHRVHGMSFTKRQIQSGEAKETLKYAPQ